MDVILRRGAPTLYPKGENLVDGTESYVNSENEILRSAEGPEPSRRAQDDKMRKRCHSECPLDRPRMSTRRDDIVPEG
jgi:hypothetical protein